MQEIADQAKNGLVLFSLGTNMPLQRLSNDRLAHIVEAFRMLPKYTFLCKCDLDTLPMPLPKNVFLRKWIPQNDILGKYLQKEEIESMD